jgi:hypothetical protein
MLGKIKPQTGIRSILVAFSLVWFLDVGLFTRGTRTRFVKKA